MCSRVVDDRALRPSRCNGQGVQPIPGAAARTHRPPARLSFAPVDGDTWVVGQPRRFDADRAAPELAARKGDHTIAVCLPARDEAATVGTIVETLRRALVDEVPLVDELVVIDDHSTDDTARVAADAGATVVRAADVCTDVVEGPGKGQALWKSLHETASDIVVWCDSDITEFGPHFVTGTIGVLVDHPEISFVKGHYERPLVEGEGGGRVTELLARPTLAALFPDVARFSQPLSGEYGGRRRLLETLSFVDGYGVDIALLIDSVRAVGADGVAEVDLGERRHRNRTIDDLGPQATAVLRAALSRAGHDPAAAPAVLHRPGKEPLLVPHRELPPLVDLESYRRRSA